MWHLIHIGFIHVVHFVLAVVDGFKNVSNCLVDVVSVFIIHAQTCTDLTGMINHPDKQSKCSAKTTRTARPKLTLCFKPREHINTNFLYPPSHVPRAGSGL